MKFDRNEHVRFTYVLYDAKRKRAFAAFDFTRNEVRKLNFQLRGKSYCMWLLLAIFAFSEIRPMQA